jgi:hypothetical protein
LRGYSHDGTSIIEASLPWTTSYASSRTRWIWCGW